MKNKPRDEWHNFDFTNEKRLGMLEIAISINQKTAQRLIEDLQKRVVRNTGLRFKFIAQAAQEIIIKDKKKFVSYQLFSKDDSFIFPEKSEHTAEYNSRYNRVEFYIPIEKLACG